MNIKTLRLKVDSGEYIKGTHIFAGMYMLTECIAQAGFDVLWIDMEHTAIGIESLQMNLIAAKAGGTPAVVRIPWNNHVLAKPVLDMGADGIIFPYIRTADEAREAVRACTYPPSGVRGFGPLRALDYGASDVCEYVAHKCKECLCIVQIEHIDAVNHLQEIVDVDGVDAYIVGMNDLAFSMGYPGDILNSEMLRTYEKIADIMLKNNKPFGVSAGSDPDILKSWKDRGAKIIFAGHDVEYVRKGAQSMLNILTHI